MLKKQFILPAILAFALTDFCVAQKIKYKDLFNLLETENYDKAEPLLKQYLGQPGQEDHPNANLQMAIIYYEKGNNQSDINNKLANIDSAIHFYSKAKALINEKEIKKNDQFYKAYYRRDLRTGKMGVKLSDVHLDIETKVINLKENKEKIINSQQD